MTGGSGRFGIVLGAGGVLGASWTIGALRALEEKAGCDPRQAEVIIGTSAGAITAAALGCGVGTEALAATQSGIAMDERIDYDYVRASATPSRPRWRLGSAGLLLRSALPPWRVGALAALSAVLPQGRGNHAAVEEVVDAVAPAGPIAWAPHPRTWIVAMDYHNGERTVFGREGSPATRLSRAVAASCSIPGWFSAVRIGDRSYVDGGTCSPTSLDLVIPLDLDVVFVLSPMTSFDYDRPTTMGQRLERGARRLFTRRLVKEATQVRQAGTEAVLLGPGPEDLQVIGANLMNPARRRQVFETSLRTTADALAQTRWAGYAG